MRCIFLYISCLLFPPSNGPQSSAKPWPLIPYMFSISIASLKAMTQNLAEIYSYWYLVIDKDIHLFFYARRLLLPFYTVQLIHSSSSSGLLISRVRARRVFLCE